MQSILEQEVAALRTVLSTLEDEHAALLERAPDALRAASDAKAEAVAQAIRLEQQRRALDTRAADRGNDEAAAGTALVTRLRGELRQLAGDCRALNDRNGQLIRGQRRRIEGSLNLLRGRTLGPDTYGRDGTGTFPRGPGAPLASY